LIGGVAAVAFLSDDFFVKLVFKYKEAASKKVFK
jgi:hypothetical protein